MTEQPDWDYSSEYCDGCAELGLTTCSCEPDEPEVLTCSNCGEEMFFDQGMCDECEEEEARFLEDQNED